MKSPDEQALAAELRALRPTPRPEFTSELDARATAGFPRRGAGALGDRLSAATGRATNRLRISRRRLLAPAGGLAVASILVATVIVVNNEGGGADRTVSTTQADSGSDRGYVSPGAASNHDGSGHYTPGRTEMYAEEPPLIPAAKSAGGEASASSSEAQTLKPFSEESKATVRAGTGPYASQANHRDVERSAAMVLGTDPADVRSAAGKIFTAVHAYDGIVLESSIEDGGEGEAGASFELLIPSGKLGDALAAFSSIAEVRSRHESTADVTAKTVGLGERLQDSRATISGLLEQLADADTDGERAAAEAELHSERLRAAALRANLADLQRRANLSQVSLQIESGEEGAAPADQNGSWGVGDALGDAGHILEVAAGVALIGLAIIAPFAIIALLAWLARRNGVRRARERGLG
jgi:hypothetical protein